MMNITQTTNLSSLRVTNSYTQKKKDSVQAALIQLHSVKQARNYPDNIDLVSRLPNNIGLPDYIGLVKYCQSSIGGRDFNLVNNVHSVDCLALRCLRLISPCKAVTMNWAVLSPSFLFSSIASTIACGTRTSRRFDFAFTDFVAIAGFLYYWCPTIIYKKNHNSILDVSHTLPLTCVRHLEFLKVINSETPQCWSTNGASDHNVKESYDMAMYKSTQTYPKFKWRFFSCQQSKYFSVEASNEKEARSLLPDSPCLFSARIRQEGDHA